MVTKASTKQTKPAATEKPAKTESAAGGEGSEDNKVGGILTGRMPIPFVFCIKFLEDQEQTDSELAKKYLTTPGKINDIRKNAGFQFVTKDLVLTNADVKAARAAIKEKLEANDRGVQEADTKYMLGQLKLIETGEESNLDELREKHRKPRAPKVGEVEGKKDKKKKDEPEEQEEEEEEESVDDLVE